MTKIKKSHFLLIGIISLIALVSPNVYAANCPLGDDVTRDLYGALKIIRIVAPLLVIAFSTLDTIKALTKGDGGSELKKVAQKFGKRCIYAVILFFLPMLIDLFMQMADVWDANGNCLQEIEDASGTSAGNTTTTTKSPQTVCQEQGKTWDATNNKCIESGIYAVCSNYDGQGHNDRDRYACENAGCSFNWSTGECSPK